MPAWPPVPRVGDGVIGSPPAFGAVQSRFESESPSRLPTCRRPRRFVIPQEPSVPVTAGGPALAAVVVLAAGEGTRMRSATPKVLHEIGGRSLLGHVARRGRARSTPGHRRRRRARPRAGRRSTWREIAPDVRSPSSRRSRTAPATPSGCALEAPCPTWTAPSCVVTGDAPLLRGRHPRRPGRGAPRRRERASPC